MNTKKVIFIGGLVLIVVAVLILRSVSKKENIETELLTPTEAPEIIVEESETGAIFLTPTEDEAKMYDSIREIRDSCPIDMGDFIIDFNYKRYKFVVKTTNEDLFWQWMERNDYVIPEEEIIFE